LSSCAIEPINSDLQCNAEVVSYQPIPNEYSESYASLLFSGVPQRIRAPNPEILGGYVSLVATNNNRVEISPNSLDRMHACLQKKVAFNQRILRNEEEVSAVSSGLADLLQDMRMDEPWFACINGGGRMRGTQPVCGQV
jgi:hypothetical protein